MPAATIIRRAQVVFRWPGRQKAETVDCLSVTAEVILELQDAGLSM